MAKPVNRLDLGALAAFAAIARRRSFRGAALELGVSPSTLSATLRELEAEMGVRLLNRTTRSVAVTDAGAALLARLQPALAEITEAVSEARSAQSEPAGPLRINAPQPAVDLVLAPLVARFLKGYPTVRVEVTAETSFVDIVAEGYDAGVRWGESLAQDMVAVPLSGPQRYVVVGSPDLIARTGRPEHPRDLLAMPCLRVRFPSGAEPPWEFDRAGETLRVSPMGPILSSNAAMLQQGALGGLGYLQTFEGYVQSHLAAGRLVEVLADWSEPFPGPFLYYPSRRTLPSPLRAFVDFVQAERRR